MAFKTMTCESVLERRSRVRARFAAASVLVAAALFVGPAPSWATPVGGDCGVGESTPCESTSADVAHVVFVESEDEALSHVVSRDVTTGASAGRQPSAAPRKDYPAPSGGAYAPASATRVPETASLLLFGSALAGLASLARRRKKVS